MTSQLERLIEDAKQLDNYIQKIQKKGKTDLVNKLSRKRTFLNGVIAEYKQRVMQ